MDLYKRTLTIIGLIAIMISLITGCSTSEQDFNSIEKDIEEKIGGDIVIPKPDGLSILGITLLAPPTVDGEQYADSYITSISYGLEQGELIELTEEQKKDLSKDMEVLYGIYDGAWVVNLEIRNGGSFTDSAETTVIESIGVQFSELESENGKMEMANFNYGNFSYYLIFKYSDEFTRDDALKLTEDLIESLN